MTISYINSLLVNKSGEILLVQRKFNGDEGGKRSLPGGTVEKNEGGIAALQRELLEELGIKVNNFQYLDRIYLNDQSYAYYFISELYETPNIILEKNELEQYQFIQLKHIDSLGSLAFFQNQIIEKYIKTKTT